MNCPKCQFEIHHNDVFCPNCGFELSQDIQLKPVTTGFIPILDQRKSDLLITDEFSSFIYAVSFFFFPAGIWIWAFYRADKPTATKKILGITVLGFLFWVILLSQF